jgi:hypothetical protein
VPVRRALAPLAVLAVLAVVTAVAGCGGGGGASTSPTTTTPDTAADVRAVRGVVVRFGTASAAKDYRTICRVLLAPALVREVEAIGLPCEAALDRGLGTVGNPRLAVGTVRVRGDNASAATHSTADGQAPSDDLVELVRVHGRWAISTLAGGGEDATATGTTTTPTGTSDTTTAR